MNADTFNALRVPVNLPWKQALTVMDDTAQGVLLAVDTQGRLWIADTHNQRVRVFTMR